MATKTFVQRVVVFLKSDDAESIGKKIQKKAAAALTAQIAVQNAKTLELEEAVENALEAKDKVLFNNGAIITSNDEYSKGILVAARAVEDAEEALEDHKSRIENFKTALKEVNG